MTSDEVIERLRDWPFMGKAMATATADHIEQLAVTNEELIKERDEAWKRAAHAEKMWGEAEVKLAKALTALGDVQWFVKDLEPYADQGHTLVPALQKACAVYVELTGGKNG